MIYETLSDPFCGTLALKIILMLCLLVSAIPENMASEEEDVAPTYAFVLPWTIAIDKSMNSGCFLYAQFERGTFLRIGKDNRHNTLYVFIGDPHWQLIEFGRNYSIQIRFGEREPWKITATGTSFDPPSNQPIIGFKLASDFDIAARFLHQFMKEEHMEISLDGINLAWIDLSNSYRAGMTLMECQRLVDQKDRVEIFQ